MSQIATDIYTPSIPAIATYFAVPVRHIQQSLAIYTVGVAATLLIYGPLSEAIGRRKALLIGSTIALLGAALSLFAQSAWFFLLGRLIQGMGVGAAAGLWRSIFRDHFFGDDMAKYLAYFVNIALLSVVSAPLLGGLIETFLNWRVSFVILVLYALVAIVLLLFTFQESHQTADKSKFRLSFIVSGYQELLFNRQFVGFNLISSLAFGGIFTWITDSPVLIIKRLHYSPALFGALVIFAGLAMFLGTTFNAKQTKRLGGRKLLAMGVGCMLLAAILLLFAQLIFGLTLVGMLAPITLFVFGASLVFPNAFSLAFENAGHIAGIAGGLYSFIQLLGGVVFGFIISYLPAITALPISILLIVISILACLILWFISSAKPLAREP